MSIAFEHIELAAMQLDVHERARLAEHLLATLDEEDEIHHAWLAEAERRAQAIDDGTEQTLPLEQVLAELRAKHR